MLDWVEILKRILHVYKVSNQQELGMALGIPIHVGMGDDRRHLVIPWPILELVVHDKGVSWDWLLTGEEKTGSQADVAALPTKASDRPEAEKGTAPADVPIPLSPLRFETRQLARSLLDDEHDSRPGHGSSPGRDALRDDLRRLRDAMRRDLEEADRLLGETESEEKDL